MRGVVASVATQQHKMLRRLSNGGLSQLLYLKHAGAANSVIHKGGHLLAGDSGTAVV
jgi:hypothetical protein